MLVFFLAFLTICYIVDSMSLDKCQEIWLYYCIVGSRTTMTKVGKPL